MWVLIQKLFPQIIWVPNFFHSGALELQMFLIILPEGTTYIESIWWICNCQYEIQGMDHC